MAGVARMAVMALAAGCAGPYGPPPYTPVDRSAQTWAYCGPGEYLATAREAVSWWRAAGQRLFIERQCGEAAVHIRAFPGEERKSEGRHWWEGNRLYGWADTYDLTADVSLYAGAFQSRRHLVATLRHELGHVFGFGHTGDPECLMTSDSAVTTDFCPVERELLGLATAHPVP